MITLGVDCGTQGLKTIALDLETGDVLASASRAYPLLEGLPPGSAEQDPAVWVAALEETLSEVLGHLGSRRSAVCGIGVAGQQHGFVPLDAGHRVIRPAKLWCDTTTTEECHLFAEAFDGTEGLLEKIGVDILPGYTAPKVLWLKRREPENYARLAQILLPHDYLNLYLGGIARMEYGDASGTALFDIRQRRWHPEVCSFIDPELEAKLPLPSSSCGPIATLRRDLARKWGLPPQTILSAGGGDNMMGAIGTGNTRSGRITASLGTSGTLLAYSPVPVVDPSGEIAAFCDSTDAWLPLLCTMNVTVATERARALFGWSHEAFDQAAAATDPGADGLLFLPYLQGERTPNLPDAHGSLHGMNPGNFTSGHIARAVLEGVTLGMAWGLGRLRALGIQGEEIRLIGGGSKSPLWRALCADVFGLPTVTTCNPEGVALGAAIQAAAACYPEKTIDEWAGTLVKTSEASRVLPNLERHSLYQRLLENFRQLTLSLYPPGRVPVANASPIKSTRIDDARAAK